MYFKGLFCIIAVSGMLASAGFPQESGGPSAESVRHDAEQAYEKRAYKQCAELFEKAAGLGEGKAVINDHYNTACCYGRAGDLDRAFAALERAVSAGYNNINHMKGDADLQTLRADPRWEKLLETIDVPVIKITDELPANPDEARFVYDDVHNFMRAAGLIAEGADAVAILEKEYFARGTPGLKQFVVKYGLTAEAVAAAMKKRHEKYAQLPERLEQLKSRESDLRAAYVKFKEVVPQAVFPPTYFLVADHSGIASGSPDGQLITLERRTEDSTNGIETLLVHELLHFQQLVGAGPDEFYALFGEKKSLLGLAIREGAAEFVAKRITGRITQQDALDYVLQHEREVWRRFEPQMLSAETSGWMWSTPEDPDQPKDVAYALGSRIVEAYYEKFPDKREAMQGILTVVDYANFLRKSGYAGKVQSP